VSIGPFVGPFVVAFLGVGSNLGERLANLQRAVDLLGSEPGIRAVASSRVWETDPVGGPAQPDFLNVVLRIETSLSPQALLAACNRVEAGLGRVREQRFGPRTLDVDILLFGAEIVGVGDSGDEGDLSIPHPRMLERAFVLLPLLEIEPDATLPDGRRIVDLRLEARGDARPFAAPLVVAG
jgi:2-amino-4-hydroxy-6-hydroxymethyldihydropteridine diphosphokinase